MNKIFDVFLSHNTKDKPAVRELAEALRARGLKVWLDEWELVPGRPWQEALEDVIETTGASVVLVGKDGLGPWQDREMRSCLNEFARRQLPVIPVLLPNAPKAPKLPIFLNDFTWVDLRGGLTEEGIDRLHWGITGKRPDRSAVSYLNLQEQKPSVRIADPDKTLVSEQPSSGPLYDAPTPAPNERVLYYKNKILTLREDVEDPESRRTLDIDIRKLAKQLADLIGEIDEDQLRPAVKIIQHEYRGWALLMAVSSFAERPSQDIAAASRIDYGQKAVVEFDLALDLMADITRKNRSGVPAAIPIYTWMTGPSEDLNRTHYLKAVALAVIARASGHTPQAALAELSAVKPRYLVKFPPENNPDLAWALLSRERYSSRGDDL